MVYLKTGKPATAETTTVAAVWTERIESEYREMPGLRLTLAQAARFWGLQPPQCLALLGALVKRGRLARTPEGLYCVEGDLRRDRRGSAGHHAGCAWRRPRKARPIGS